jgi:hypothetical protein
MSLTMEILINVSLTLFIVSTLATMGAGIWYLRMYAPVIRNMTKDMNGLYSSDDEETA